MGNAYGAKRVWYFYEKGIGVKMYEWKAFEYYKKSADMDNANRTERVSIVIKKE